MRIIILPLTVIWLYTFSVTKELACYLLLFPNHPILPMNLTMVFSLTFLFLCLLLCVSCCVLLMVVQCIVAITLHLTSKCFTTGRAVSVPQPCCGTDGILAEALPLVHKSLRCSTQCSRNQSTGSPGFELISTLLCAIPSLLSSNFSHWRSHPYFFQTF